MLIVLVLKNIYIRTLLKLISIYVPSYIINLDNNVLHNLLDYGNEYIEKISFQEGRTRNSLLIIDSFIDEKVKLRDDFMYYMKV